MFSMALDSAKLLFAGKLFQDTAMVIRQFAIGVLVGALVTVVIGFFAATWIAAAAGGAVAGFLQPILFRDLKYA